MNTSNIESGHRLLAETVVAASQSIQSRADRFNFLHTLRKKLDCAASHYEAGFADDEVSDDRAMLTFHSCGQSGGQRGDIVAVDFDHRILSNAEYVALLTALNYAPIREELSKAVRAATLPSKEVV